MQANFWIRHGAALDSLFFFLGAGELALLVSLVAAAALSSCLLDDGWPESVEEQGLLLLVWRHHITKHYIKDVL